MNTSPRLHLFEGYGVELEYMIVHRDTLNVMPIADRLLREIGGNDESEVEVNGASWSNELVMHVIELKNSHPTASLAGLPALFQRQIEQIDELLKPLGAMLLPTGMHPWMDPATETRLWPHAYHEVYEAYHRIFDCYRHGWANLQSIHLNLPFADEEEFARLHAAIRVLLPILPAIAASSPIADGRVTGLMDTRMEVYRSNSSRVPSIAGEVIPEPIFSIDQYQEQILERAYTDIAPYDREGVLQDEFLNARGAIARFDRGAIEIRVLDVQECPEADVAICAIVSYVIRELVAESWSDIHRQQSWSVAPLYEILVNCIKDADRTVITNREYLDLFGYRGAAPATAQQLWSHLIETGCQQDAEFAQHWRAPLSRIIRSGPLSRRMLQQTPPDAKRGQMEPVYRSLSTCLRSGIMFQ